MDSLAQAPARTLPTRLVDALWWVATMPVVAGFLAASVCTGLASWLRALRRAPGHTLRYTRYVLFRSPAVAARLAAARVRQVPESRPVPTTPWTPTLGLSAAFTERLRHGDTVVLRATPEAAAALAARLGPAPQAPGKHAERIDRVKSHLEDPLLGSIHRRFRIVNAVRLSGSYKTIGLHFDRVCLLTRNVYLQLEGKKRVIILDPAHAGVPLDLHTFSFQVDCHEALETVLAHVPHYEEVILEPGDILIEDASRWHYFENLTPHVDSISCRTLTFWPSNPYAWASVLLEPGGTAVAMRHTVQDTVQVYPTRAEPWK